MTAHSLRALALKPTYHKGDDDIAKAFYLPAFAVASSYDRAVGFFSSAVYAIAWPSLRTFASKGGRIRMLCSPVLSAADIDALEHGHEARLDAGIATRLVAEIRQMLASEHLVRPTRVLAGLVAADILDVKIAFLLPSSQPRVHRLFHDKLGIFSDQLGDQVVFKGSMNETWTGLALDGNLESIDVYVSWGGDRERHRVEEEQSYFDKLWSDLYSGVRVRPFPDVARDELIAATTHNDWNAILDQLNSEFLREPEVEPKETHSRHRPLRDHQSSAVEAWVDSGRRGILEHATGSGKTLTALAAVRDSFSKGEVTVVLVPSDLLLIQWEGEIGETLGDLNPHVLVCGGGHNAWRRNGLLRAWTRAGGESNRIVLATMQTAIGDAFLADWEQGSHIFLVADEVHRIGSPECQKLLYLETGPRLGLSATPARAGDPVGTALVFDYFGGVVHRFSLRDAIDAKLLTPYMYYVHEAELLPSEQLDWDVLSRKIGVAYAISQSGGTPDSDSYVQHLQIQRARIPKQAAAKPALAVEVLRDSYRAGQKWLVYCDSQDQLGAVLDGVGSLDLPVSEYHSGMVGDRKETLRHFDLNGGVLVSIRCLDEGVDIPSVTHALILASSKNPREFIQRRGRVLRRAAGKHLSYVHDVIVVPSAASAVSIGPSLLEGELARAIKFGEEAENPAVVNDLRAVAINYGIDYEKLTEAGVESDAE